MDLIHLHRLDAIVDQCQEFCFFFFCCFKIDFGGLQYLDFSDGFEQQKVFLWVCIVSGNLWLLRSRDFGISVNLLLPFHLIVVSVITLSFSSCAAQGPFHTVKQLSPSNPAGCVQKRYGAHEKLDYVQLFLPLGRITVDLVIVWM